jgi:hypothetical protein
VRFAQGLLLVLVLGGIGLVLGVLLQSVSNGSAGLAYFLIVGPVVSMLGIVVVSIYYLVLYKPITEFGERFLIADAKDVMATDVRPPVLYLRPFVSERTVAFVERQFVAMLRSVGPVVAVGRPHDTFPRLGAVRLYLADEEWQSVVSDFMNRSSLVILVAGKGRGLQWELTECIRVVGYEKLILLIPGKHEDLVEFAQQFRELTGAEISACFESQRPSWRDFVGGALLWRAISSSGVNGLVTFDKRWHPTYHSVQIRQSESNNDLYERLHARLWHVFERAVQHLNQGRATIGRPLLLLDRPPLDKVGHAAFRVMRVAEVVRLILVLGFGLILLIGALGS